MDEPIRIPASPPPYKSQDYDFLREEGLKVIREIAGASWTDHNIHDPGITLLEACCYAMTEVGLRSGLDMADLLSSGESFAQQEFFTASQVLPVAPVSSIDFQKVLLDHPLVRNGWVSKSPETPRGKLSVLLEFADDTLNSNIFSLLVTPPGLGREYRIDLAFPYWDEPDLLPFQEDVQILNAAFTNAWQPLKNENARFASISLDYQPAAGPADSLELWLVLQVTSPLNDTLVELPQILQETENLLFTLPNENVFKAYNERIINANAAMRSVQKYLRDYRNLCEDFPDFKAVRLQEIAFSAVLEVSSGVDVPSLLASIFFAVDQHLSPPVFVKSLSELKAEDKDSAAIFEGPLMEEGFLQTDALLSSQPPSQIYASDILRLIFQQRNAEHSDVHNREKLSHRSIIALKSLTLSNWLDNHAITKGAKDCLQLVDSRRHVPRLSPAKCRIDIIRNNVKINYDFGLAIERFRALKETYLHSILPGSEDIPVPRGNVLPLRTFYPVQNELPVVYGVGKYGLPGNVSPERKAKAKQLKGYLFFYEQLIAGHLAQLSHLNALFSADPDLDTTVFHQWLYQLPLVAELFGFEDQSMDWENFQADESNPYNEVLKSAEPREQFLERRNRFLDHLLARLGEDMQEYAEMVFQEEIQAPSTGEIDLNNLLAVEQAHYINALERLIRDKSAFYYDLPLLNRDRFQSFGNLLWRLDSVIEFHDTPLGIHWQISNAEGQPVLESLEVAASRMEAEKTAALALKLATSESNYVISAAAGLNSLLLRQNTNDEPVARSVQNFETVALAEAARDMIAQSLLETWLDYALIPLERRLYHFLGIRVMQRRLLIHPFEEYFEVFDAVDNGPAVEKGFRLREFPGASGDILLESFAAFEGPDDSTATEAALQGIDTLIGLGRSDENFSIEETDPGQFQILLGMPGTDPLARSGEIFPDQEAARGEITRLMDHIYRHYSREGFYMIEHALLAPPDSSAPGLLIPEPVADAYSFQISFVFPSGYDRNFADPESVAEAAHPRRFREEEFRQYVENTVRKACPAHILARIHWVDSAARGSTVTGDVPCFDQFETRYRDWLRAYLGDGTASAEMENWRANLVACLNAIYQISWT